MKGSTLWSRRQFLQAVSSTAASVPLKRYLYIGAHPDDAELLFGGTAIRLIRSGHVVKFVSTTNGDAGHFEMPPAELARRRWEETQAVARVAGLAEYQVLDSPDGRLEASLPNRERIVRLIRQFAPDVVITHRPNDYHPDHRATAQLVRDASFLIRVPLFCPETTIPHHWPVFLASWDRFQQPAPFRPDVCVPIDDVLDAKLAMLDCHASQFYEWIPWLEGNKAFDVRPMDPLERLSFLHHHALPPNRQQADLYREQLCKRFDHAADQIRHIESFELSEYGRQTNLKELAALFLVPTQNNSFPAHPPVTPS